MRGKAVAAAAWTALASALLGLAAYRLGFGALGAVLDTRPAGAVLAVAAVAVALLGSLGRGRERFLRGHRLIAVAAAVVAVVTGALLAHDLFFAYRSEDVSFSSGKIRLFGTLYLPSSGVGPFPAVVLAHGAGQETRTGGGYYARMFARHGIAALAYDKRGSGESGGDLETATYEELAADALAAARYLEARVEIAPDLIGFKGTSEGGWVVPIAAAARERTAFAILVSTTAESPAEQVRYEVGEKVRRAGFDAATATRASELYGRLSRFERTGEGREELDRELQRAAAEAWFTAAGYLPAKLPTYEEVQRLSWFPAWRARMDFDAASYLGRVRCPVLLLLGGRDPKMSSDRAAATVRRALAAGGEAELTVRVYPQGEHGLVVWYLPARLPPPRFPAGFPQMMADWVLDAVARRPGPPAAPRGP